MWYFIGFIVLCLIIGLDIGEILNLLITGIVVVGLIIGAPALMLGFLQALFKK